MTLYDISRTLNQNLAVWPGDKPFKLSDNARIVDGDMVNVTTLTAGCHTGTHIDAPYHFDNNGITIEKLDLSIYWGPAQVVHLDKPAGGPLHPDDFAGVDLQAAPRLLLHTPASHKDPARFWEDFLYPTVELANFLGSQGIILFGTDAPSVDPVNGGHLNGHHALQRNGILILEGLWLADVPTGLYELAALPLKLEGNDGSPVRAVLRSL